MIDAGQYLLVPDRRCRSALSGKSSRSYAPAPLGDGASAILPSDKGRPLLAAPPPQGGLRSSRAVQVVMADQTHGSCDNSSYKSSMHIDAVQCANRIGPELKKGAIHQCLHRLSRSASASHVRLGFLPPNSSPVAIKRPAQAFTPISSHRHRPGKGHMGQCQAVCNQSRPVSYELICRYWKNALQAGPGLGEGGDMRLAQQRGFAAAMFSTARAFSAHGWPHYRIYRRQIRESSGVATHQGNPSGSAADERLKNRAFPAFRYPPSADFGDNRPYRFAALDNTP